MAHHGYIPLIKQYLHQAVPKDATPSVLEVGVDRGVTYIPLLVFLSRTRENFMMVGIDIKVQESTLVTRQHIDLLPTQQAFFIEDNSLVVLPKMVDQGMQFDVVLLDGDHNYHTVKKEMQHMERLVKPTGILVCDDYNGRWAKRDLWYSERPGYEDVKVATTRVITEKHGVKTAIDEWLVDHPNWQLSKPIAGEPVMLMRKKA